MVLVPQYREGETEEEARKSKNVFGRPDVTEPVVETTKTEDIVSETFLMKHVKWATACCPDSRNWHWNFLHESVMSLLSC